MGEWPLVVSLIVGCFAFKLAGYYAPERWLRAAVVRRLLELLPAALLAALVVVQALSAGRHIDLNGPRLAGLAVGGVLVWRRAPFPVVVLGAGIVAVLLRHL